VGQRCRCSHCRCIVPQRGRSPTRLHPGDSCARLPATCGEDAMDSLLAGWESFYVIVGSSAGRLTGLTFVVIALAADARAARPRGVRAFVTPIILPFGQVLALAAFLSMPHPSILALSIGFATAAVVGLIWSGIILANIPANSSDYQPVWEDWLWNV